MPLTVTAKEKEPEVFHVFPVGSLDSNTYTIFDNKIELILMNLQPQIYKVFKIINALPSQQVFSSTPELDHYFDRIQRKIKEEG